MSMLLVGTVQVGDNENAPIMKQIGVLQPHRCWNGSAAKQQCETQAAQMGGVHMCYITKGKFILPQLL